MAGSPERQESAGLAVRVEANVPCAALRYFSRAGGFAAALGAAGVRLPETGQAWAAGGQLTLAWRSPSETLCVARDEARLAQLRDTVTQATDGCCVELTGALTLLSLTGPRVADLIARLGGSASLPGRGEARRSRMADVPVLALCVTDAEVQLLLDRVYAEHLLGWIRETLLDFA
jgi:heterotetrameric sarcosine oxidase gamma subunit